MKRIGLFIILILVTTVISACSSSEEKVKVGISGSDTAVWDFIAEKAEKEDIEIEIVRFSDYVQPNLALAEGSIDINAFQTVAYFDVFIDEHDLDLVPIATTMLAPMALYSEKHTEIEDLPDGATIALDSEASNQGRGLALLEEAGLITLEDDYDGIGDLNKIVDNPKDLKFEQLAAAQTPRVLADVDAAIINNGIAVDAGFSPVDDSIYREDETAIPYVNIIAAKEEDKDNEVYQKIVEIYQTDEVEEVIIEDSGGSRIPTFLPLSEIGY